MPPFNFIKQEIRPDSIPDPKVDATFRKVVKNAINFAIWKIDEDHLEAVNKTQIGSFYDNCAYIIYAATTLGHYANQDTITREQKHSVPLERFIHYWLGSNVTEQSRSNVVHKVQELDTYLGNVAAIYRETQDYESARFLSYFKKGYDIRCGALVNIAANEPHLYRLHGRKWLRSIQMPEVCWAHFSSAYIMVLKTHEVMYVWIGRATSLIERRTAMERAIEMQSSGIELILVDDGYEKSIPDLYKKKWNTLLPLNQRAVSQSPAQQVTADTQNHSGKDLLYKCNFRGRVYLDQVNVATPSKEDLNDSNAVFLLDSGEQGIWVWVGNQVTQADCLQAMGNGRAFVRKKKYPDTTMIARVVEGHEPMEFKRLFANWLYEWQDGMSHSHKPVASKFGKLDAITLCERPKMAAYTQLIDDGSGERVMYCITQSQVTEISACKTVVFTKNQCYVIKYEVVCASSKTADFEAVGVKSIIYQWNGSEANTEAIAKAETFAKHAFESSNGKTILVQMSECDETPHFLQIFEGNLIVMQSNKDSLLINNSSINHINCLQLETFILKIYGDATYNAKAVEMDPSTDICTKYCYIFKTNHIWIWCGQSTTGDAREIAKNIGTALGESSLIFEGKESKEFWQSAEIFFKQPLNMNGLKSAKSNSSGSSSNSSTSSKNSCGSMHGSGKISPTSCSSYLNTVAITAKTGPMPQLFLVWWEQNKFEKREIYGYEQNDLHSDCAYILDTSTIAFVWLGEYAAADIKQQYLNIGQIYLKQLKTERHPSMALAIVLQHDEPNIFKGFFDPWNSDIWKCFTSYDQMRHLLVTQNGNTNDCNLNKEQLCNGKLQQSLVNNNNKFDRHHKYPIAILQQDIDSLPVEINPLHRELHLTHDDFVAVFKMPFWDFEELPSWKKQELKKKYKLF